MDSPRLTDAQRYIRQTAFDGLGPAGQAALAAGSALIVGTGGLGSWTAELLARAGVRRLRLVDDDAVDPTNLHRQAMYDESDAAAATPKALAAARHLARIASGVAVEPVVARLDAGNVDRLADGMEVVLDGTDNFATRFLLNDWCILHGRPWVFAGVVRAEGQVMTIIPGRTPCLRCIYESPPPPEEEVTARTAGVLGPAVATIAAIQAAEALKLLAGRAERANPRLLRLDLWTNVCRAVDVAAAAAGIDCPCCKRRRFEFLRGA